MSDLQEIEILKEELAFLEEERANLEINHLQTKVQLTKELREIMDKLDSLKKNGKSNSYGEGEQERSTSTEEVKTIQKSLEKVVDGNTHLEKKISTLTKQTTGLRADEQSLRLSIEQQKEKLAETDSKNDEQGIIEGIKAKIQKKNEETSTVKKMITGVKRDIASLEVKHSEIVVKVESTKKVQAIFKSVASFRDGSYKISADYEEQARVLWNDALDGWLRSTDYFTSRDSLFFSHSYKSFHKGVKSFYILFSGEIFDEEAEDKTLEEMIDNLYRMGFSLPSHLLDNIRKIADKVEMGQDVLPLPTFWNKTFDFLKKNMNLLLIEDPSVRNL